jgi:hypothetical protein
MTDDRILQYGVPIPFEYEAPSSWLSRLALSQRCSLQDLMEFLALPEGADVDRMMHGRALEEMRRKCSLPKGAFKIAEWVMAEVQKTSLRRSRLLFDAKAGPCFKYCPGCLMEQSTPHFDIQWRFVDWRYCPLHNCLMESNCWKCSAPVCYPKDMELSKAGRGGHGSQRRCLRCSADLAAARCLFCRPGFKFAGGLESLLDSQIAHCLRPSTARSRGIRRKK